eukprot:5135606-Prymnesium_polylepis.1
MNERRVAAESADAALASQESERLAGPCRQPSGPPTPTRYEAQELRPSSGSWPPAHRFYTPFARDPARTSTRRAAGAAHPLSREYLAVEGSSSSAHIRNRSPGSRRDRVAHRLRCHMVCLPTASTGPQDATTPPFVRRND